jgi:hypothetical protein
MCREERFFRSDKLRIRRFDSRYLLNEPFALVLASSNATETDDILGGRARVRSAVCLRRRT